MNNSEFQAILAVSNVIVAVRHKDDLLRVIYEQIQQLLPFDDAGIGIINKTGDQYYNFLTDLAVPSEVNHQMLASGYFNRWLPIDPPIQKAFEAQDPLLLDVAQEARLYPDTLYFPIFEAAGIRQIMARQLTVRGVRIGAITFSSKQAHQYSEATFGLFNVIADQVAVAVANILANEEILEREREKSVLLAISTAIATINDKRQLLKLIFEQVRPLFSFDDVGLSILETDGQHFNDWAAQFTDTLPLEIASKQVAEYRFPYAGSLIEQAIDDVTAAGHPLVYDLTAALAAQWPDAQTVLSAEIADQQKQALVTTLRAGGQLVGLFNINTKRTGHFSSINQSIFQAIADQVAVAVANILATEEILQREQEKTQLLRISEAISRINKRHELLRVIYQHIQPIFSFDNAGLFLSTGH